MEQNVEFPVGGGLQDFLPGQSSSASSSSPAGVRGSADGPVEMGFRTFPQIEKVRRWARARGRNCSPSRAHPPRQLMWITGSMATTSGSALTLCTGLSGRGRCQTTCSGTGRGNGTDGSTVTMLLRVRLSLVAERQDWSLLARSLLVYPLTQWLEQPLVETVPGAASSSRCSQCEIWTLPSPSYL